MSAYLKTPLALLLVLLMCVSFMPAAAFAENEGELISGETEELFETEETTLPERTENEMIPEEAAGPEEELPEISLNILKPEKTEMTVGETVELETEVSPENTAVVWSSSDENVLTVDEDGIVTAVSAGIATVRAEAETDSRIYDELELTVVEATAEEETEPAGMEEAEVSSYENEAAESAESEEEAVSGESESVSEEAAAEEQEAAAEEPKESGEELLTEEKAAENAEIPEEIYEYAAAEEAAPAGETENEESAEQVGTVEAMPEETEKEAGEANPKQPEEEAYPVFIEVIDAEELENPDDAASMQPEDDIFPEESEQSEEKAVPETEDRASDDADGLSGKVSAINAFDTNIAKGSCGNNLTWTLNSYGVLSISGTGAMTDYEYDAPAPWNGYSNKIKTVSMGSGITKIGMRAFKDCICITSVTIPDSVTHIGNNAFHNCSGLTSLSIPNSVKEIGDYAFMDCSGLKSLTIPGNVTKIGEYAFSDCIGLTGMTIPNSVTIIGDGAFYRCSELKSITLSSKITSIGTWVFGKCSKLDNVTIPAGVTEIGWYAFSDCSGLKSMTIPEGVSIIGESAFWNCGELASVTIPNSMASIGESAFAFCEMLSNVCYTGTAGDWGKIDIGSDNNALINAARTYKPKTYTITYNANGGTGAPANGTKVYAQPYTIPTTKPTRTGYTFLGWGTSKTATAAKYLPGKTYTSLSSFNLYAVWEPKTYTVTYNANGGTGAPADGKKVYAQPYTIPTTKPTRTGYDFLGWATSKTATTAKYLPGKTYSSLSSFSLYAVWKAKTYTVTFNANGGTGAPADGKKVYAQPYTIPTTKPARYGYDFLGWAASKTATTAKYLPGKTYSSLSSFNLYAVWKAKTYTVTYNANGGTGAPANGTKVYAQPYTIPTTKPARTGYTFLGWSVSKSATSASYLPGKTYSSLSGFSLYAVWKKN